MSFRGTLRPLAIALCALAAIHALAGSGDVTTARAASVVSAFPSPGTPDASPTTQVSFRGVAPSAIGALTVTGSSTGRHAGRLAAHSDGQGASFLPSRPFAPGETVTVTTALPVAGAANGRFSITIAREVRQTGPTVPESPGGPGDVLRFRSRPGLVPPRYSVRVRRPGIAPGLVFLGPKTGPGQDGPEIVDDSGQPVYFKALRAPLQAYDVGVQRYRGAPVLTWWQGTTFAFGVGDGEGEIYDTSYHRVATVRAGNGYAADLHEFRITGRNTALVTAYQPVRWDTSSAHGPAAGLVRDSIVQEIDIPTGLVLFEWHSLGHVPLSDSYFPVAPRPEAWDYFHVNSIDQDADGNLIVSSRNTSTVYAIDPATGGILWRLGGKHSSFTLGAGVRFALQHDATVQADGTLSIFDNSAAPRSAFQSRGLRVRLDRTAMTATLASPPLTHDHPLSTANQGSVQLLPGGNTLVGWGNHAWATEFDAQGRVVWDLKMPRRDQSYRAMRSAWVATPPTRPSVSATDGPGGITAYASWNGATQVASWRLLAGADGRSLRAVATAARTGFETRVSARRHDRAIAVEALDAAGRVLQRSHTIRAR